ncbi:AfsR/SARP family transcriptional regulator, partial [Streptomyces sp. SID486]|uniref:BTAD domain-containing putative transcriptional regulator n=1 Tax=Streptomyces sp. SID486 TaxID=2690264 RepID=UPI00136E466F
MRFGVLGPLAVWDDEGAAVRVPEAKVRALLADLLAHDGGPVSADRLIHDLWGDRPPGRPAGSLQAKVSQLRRALGRDRVVHQPSGYRLRLEDTDEVDAARFRDLVDRAGGVPDPGARAALLTEALELWRGPAYADFADREFVRGAVQRLTEQRLSVLEEQAEARLATGEQVLLAGELADLVARHPLRERLRALQIRALYAAGRQSEALAAYEDLRTRLVAELGVDPSPELTSLHQAVLRQDPELTAIPQGATVPASSHPHPTPVSGTGLSAAPAGTPATAAEAPPAPSNLPVCLTPLIGRRDALDRLAELLRGARLVTLTGPGGVGKSRLAVAAAEELRNPGAHEPTTGPSAQESPTGPRALHPTTGPSAQESPAGPRALHPAADPSAHGAAAGPHTHGAAVGPPHTHGAAVGPPHTHGAAVGPSTHGAAEPVLPDGTWFVEFSGVRTGTAADLAQLVAASLGISDHAPSAVPVSATGTRSPVHHLAAVLRDRRMLLVLDNCEHVVDAAAELATLLLRTAPGLRVLATSQEPLGLPGEEVFLVEPLPTADAVQLFTQRAAAAAPGFSLAPDSCDDSDRAAVTEICRRLDGIPLALELAATRVRALGVRELSARLGDRFRLLTSGRRGAPERQQTLRAVIDWSWELLSAPERIVLRRLAAFGDGCDLRAAEAVCAGDGVADFEVPDLVIRLVERSLVVVGDGPTGPRYRLLESVAAYATERLHEMEDLTAVRDRHLRHYLALAERAEPELRGAGQRSWLVRLDAEAGNLRVALDEALRRAAAGAPAQAARLATALAWWWLLRGRLTQARRSLRAVLDTVTTATEPPAQAELALLHCAFALLTGDRQAAVTLPDDTALPDPVRRARALWLCAYGLFSAGAPNGDELNDRALALSTVAGDPWGTAAALGLRATLALIRGDLAGLGRDGRRSAALFREVGDRWGELQTVSPLAALAEIKGEYGEAEDRQYEGLRIARELGLAAEVSARLSGLGRLALLARDWDRARDLHEQARRSAAEQGYKYGEIHAEMGLALGARRSGDLDAAETHLGNLRDGYAAVSSQAGDHLVLAERGFVAELRGDAERAAALHLRGLEAARALGEPRALALSLEGLAGAAALRGTASAAGCA